MTGVLIDLNKNRTKAQPTADLRFVSGRLQQKWMVYTYKPGVGTDGAEEWREVPGQEGR